jgi:hypothetical protein
VYEVDDVVIPDDLIPPEVEIVGIDGNAGALMGHIAQAMKAAGNPTEMIDRFRKELMSGDYEHVIRTCMAYSYGAAPTDTEYAEMLQEQRDNFAPKQEF